LTRDEILKFTSSCKPFSTEEKTEIELPVKVSEREDEIGGKIPICPKEV